MSAPGEIVVAVGLRRRVARMNRDAVKFLVARDACAAAMTQSSCPRHRCDARRDEDEVGHEPLPCGTRGIHAVRYCAPESGRSCCHFNPDPQSESNRSSSFRHRSRDHSAARRMRIRGCRRTEGGCQGSGARRTGRLCGEPLRQSQFARQDASVRVSATPRGAMIAAVAAMHEKRPGNIARPGRMRGGALRQRHASRGSGTEITRTTADPNHGTLREPDSEMKFFSCVCVASPARRHRASVA